MRIPKFSAMEFIIVVATVFGASILVSLSALATGRTVPEAIGVDPFGTSQLYGIVLYELILMPVAAAILYARGWRPANFPFGVALGTTLLGGLIAGACLLIDAALSTALEAIFPAMASAFSFFQSYSPWHAPSMPSVIALSIVNPIFEEVFVAGYVINALQERFGVTTAVNASVVIRASYHLYQGFAAFPFHMAYGLVQAYIFVRYAKLWPLIVSHAILDLYALLWFM